MLIGNAAKADYLRYAITLSGGNVRAGGRTVRQWVKRARGGGRRAPCRWAARARSPGDRVASAVSSGRAAQRAGGSAHCPVRPPTGRPATVSLSSDQSARRSTGAVCVDICVHAPRWYTPQQIERAEVDDSGWHGSMAVKLLRRCFYCCAGSARPRHGRSRG